ncbi:MAG: alanine racemase [Anaerolinea sp.]|nr:alanine racemase [Anaerolinea sp.]
MARVTIKEIAKKAGVSVTSVSFAFNNPIRLPEATVQHILEVAEELGYIPNPIARSMKTGRTGALGILVPQPFTEIIRNPFLYEFLEGVAEVCTAAGYSLMIVPPLEGSVKRAIGMAAVDGFLTLGLELFKSTMVVLRQREVPFVMVDSDPIDGVPVVNVDDESGARAVMAHVLKAGHRDVAILGIRSGKDGHYQEYTGTLRQRMAGYISALAAFDLELDQRRVQLTECPSTISGGQKGFRQLWKRTNHLTAVVAMSDIIAIGVIDAAQQAGIRVPEDLSVVGFDDISFSKLINPALTTVSQPIQRKGKLAAELLVKCIKGECEPSHIKLNTKLIVRASVSSPTIERIAN